MKMLKTIFIDIDGTLVKHQGNLEAMLREPMEILPGVLGKLTDWTNSNYTVILITARPKSSRRRTIEQLKEIGLYSREFYENGLYDELIMGLSNAPRFLINDDKSDMRYTAHAITVYRDKGLINVNLGEDNE